MDTTREGLPETGRLQAQAQQHGLADGPATWISLSGCEAWGSRSPPKGQLSMKDSFDATQQSVCSRAGRR